MSRPTQEEQIKAFQARFESERDWCEELFQDATVKLMACKYAYYVCNNPYNSDYWYDDLEAQWYMMGLALGHLKEGEHSPCIDFDEKHPMAQKGIELAKKLMHT